MSDEAQQPDTYTREEVERFANSFADALGGAFENAVLTAQAMTLEAYASALEKAPVAAAFPFASEIAEAAMRQAARVARSIAAGMRDGITQDGTVPNANKGETG